MRTAITAAGAVDKSGLIMQKWELAVSISSRCTTSLGSHRTQGDSAVQKLSRFEESIRKLEQSRNPSSNPMFSAVSVPRSSGSTHRYAASTISSAAAPVESHAPHFTSFSASATLQPSPSKRSVLSPSSTASVALKGSRAPLMRTHSEGGAVLQSSFGSSKPVGEHAGKPLIFPKRQTPPVPLNRSASTLY